MFVRNAEDVQGVVNNVVLFRFVELPVVAIVVVLCKVGNIYGRILLFALWRWRWRWRWR